MLHNQLNENAAKLLFYEKLEIKMITNLHNFEAGKSRVVRSELCAIFRVMRSAQLDAINL